jgi:hypothetical protein
LGIFSNVRDRHRDESRCGSLKAAPSIFGLCAYFIFVKAFAGGQVGWPGNSACQAQEGLFGRFSRPIEFHPDNAATRHARASRGLIKPFCEIFGEQNREFVTHLPKA